ncbi:MAG: DUF1801 domain-containing protein [Rubrobacter sp.]|nr:DUF1801 domain-containing protein [Rubrobacter sp.]
MVKSSASTPDAYLAELSPGRREAIAEVRKVILDSLPKGYEEAMQYGMISYHIPLERYPDTYNKRPFAVALASQKNYMSLYLLGVCYNPETEQWFKERFADSGKNLDMGKSCVRFRKLDDLPLEVIGEAISHVSPGELIERYEASRSG